MLRRMTMATFIRIPTTTAAITPTMADIGVVGVVTGVAIGVEAGAADMAAGAAVTVVAATAAADTAAITDDDAAFVPRHQGELSKRFGCSTSGQWVGGAPQARQVIAHGVRACCPNHFGLNAGRAAGV